MATVQKPSEIELEPGAWGQFERAIDVVVKAPPRHRTKADRPASFDPPPAERLSPSSEAPASRTASERPVDETEAALRRLLSDQGGYIFLSAEGR